MVLVLPARRPGCSVPAVLPRHRNLITRPAAQRRCWRPPRGSAGTMVIAGTIVAIRQPLRFGGLEQEHGCQFATPLARNPAEMAGAQALSSLLFLQEGVWSDWVAGFSGMNDCHRT